MLKFSSGVLTAVVVVAAIAAAFAEQPSTPPAQAASAVTPIRIQTPRDGDAVTSPFKVQIAQNAQPGVAPASADQGRGGHHVLLIDTTLGDQDMSHPVKADAQHIVFRKDQIAALITLPPGRHTLQFVVAGASDILLRPFVQSQAVTVTVRDAGAATAAPNTGGKEAKAAEEARKAPEAKQAADEARQAQQAKAEQAAREAADAKQAQEARAAQAVREAADAKLAQEAKAAQAAREAAEAKLAQEAKAAQAAREALEASQAQQARTRAAEQALAAKEAEQALKALDARQALEDAKQARDAQQALDARLARKEDESRLALAKQAREARLAAEARRAAETSPGKADRKATAILGVRHAKAGRVRSARHDLNSAGHKLAHLKRPPIVLHPELREVEWYPRLHREYHHPHAQVYAHRQHRAQAYAHRQHQVFQHKRQRNYGDHQCLPRYHHHFNEASSE